MHCRRLIPDVSIHGHTLWFLCHAACQSLAAVFFVAGIAVALVSQERGLRGGGMRC